MSMRLMLLVALSLSGCATVAPYEREDMARVSMDSAIDSRTEGFGSHVHETREGASGGVSGSGGGCGCN